jgi:hypothetical protein
MTPAWFVAGLEYFHEDETLHYQLQECVGESVRTDSASACCYAVKRQLLLR